MPSFNVTPTQVAVNSSADALSIFTNVNRRVRVFYNNGSASAYLGGDDTVLDTTGMPLLPGGFYIDNGSDANYYAVCASGQSTTIAVLTLSSPVSIDVLISLMGATASSSTVSAAITAALAAGITTPTITGVGGTLNTIATPVIQQVSPSTPTTVTTLTVANLLKRLITATPTATGSTVVYTLPTGTNMDGGGTFVNDTAFDWSITNLAAAAADTITITANTNHTIVGNPIVNSSHSSTVADSSAVFRSRKTATNTWVTYRIS